MMKRAVCLVAAVMVGGGALEPTPVSELTEHEHLVAAKYRNTISKVPILFRDQRSLPFDSGTEWFCGYVTGIDGDGYIEGWRAYVVRRPPGGEWSAFIDLWPGAGTVGGSCLNQSSPIE